MQWQLSGSGRAVRGSWLDNGGKRMRLGRWVRASALKAPGSRAAGNPESHHSGARQHIFDRATPTKGAECNARASTECATQRSDRPDARTTLSSSAQDGDGQRSRRRRTRGGSAVLAEAQANGADRGPRALERAGRRPRSAAAAPATLAAFRPRPHLRFPAAARPGRISAGHGQ